MEAVRKRPVRAQIPSDLLEQNKRRDRHSDHEEEIVVALRAANEDIGHKTTEKEHLSAEEHLMGAEEKQEPLAAIEIDSCHCINVMNFKNQVIENAQETMYASTNSGQIHAAPSAPALENDDTERVEAKVEQKRLQTSTLRAFHEISVLAEVATDEPSAPIEDDLVLPATTPTAPSLSPTTSKKLCRLALPQQNPEKSPSVARKSMNGAISSNVATYSNGATDTNVSILVTVEEASAAVRNSFSKSHLNEQKATLYPSLPLEEHARDCIVERVENDANAKYKQLLRQNLTRVKLEPFVNYEMNLLRTEASQKRQEMKMRHIETNKGELYARLERYLFSEYLLHMAASSMEGLKRKMDVLLKKVWTLEKKRLTMSKRCGDHVAMEQQMEFQTAKLETLHLERLKSHLDQLRQLRTVEASIHTSDRAISYFQVEQYLTRVLQDPHLVAHVNKMRSCCGGSNGREDLDLVPEGVNFYGGISHGSPLAAIVDHLKYCLDVLIFFEKKVTLEEEGVFSRVPQSFYRGELIWQHTQTKGHSSGMERKTKCYACGYINGEMKTHQWCKRCESCDVVLYIPPSSVATKSSEWYSSVLRFRQSLQKWISICVQSLIRTTSLQNMPYLLMHVMYLPRISTDERSWFLRFFQFPRAMVRTDGSLCNEWSEDLVDHYIAMLHLVFHPEKLRQMATIVSSKPSNATKAANSAEIGVVDKNGLVSPEWVLLENPTMLDRYFLSDEDFVAVLNQFPNTFAFGQVFRCTLDVKKSFSRALTLVHELTNSLRAFQEFEQLPTRIAQLLGQLLCEAAEVAGSGRATATISKEYALYPTLFDQLVLASLNGLMAVECNRAAWRSLHLIPFGALSELAKWDVVALLLFNLNSIPHEAKTASGWMRFVGKPTSQDVDTRALVRQHLYDLIDSDTESSLCLLNAVASIAASCTTQTLDDRHDLVVVAVHELFMAGFTVESCQQALGANGERAAEPLSILCLAHPWVLSLLITLLYKFHKCAATWIHIFETFPINRWMPTHQDLVNLQEWLLLKDTSAPRSALARFLLDHINWEYDVKMQRLFTDAMLHRQVALMVAEALVLYKTRKERTSDPESVMMLSGGISPQKLEVTSIAKSIRRALWFNESVDFEKWCWKLMLKLRFYSPKEHEPLLPLIDLRHDRTREALTLRRWFAGASVLRVLRSRKVFPFYRSHEDHIKRSGGTDKKEQDTVALESGRSTGVPIHHENRLLLTPNNMKSGDSDTTVSATVASRTEPIVAYVICQLTTFVFSDRLDRWEPLLVLLKSELFDAAIKVLENIIPVLSRRGEMKNDLISQPDGSVTHSEKNEEAASSDETKTEAGALLSDNAIAVELDYEVEVCMAAMQALSTDELLSLLDSLHEFSYINTDELHRMQEVLKKGYIGGWESTAKARILAKLRFVRECSRYLHPVVLPALINECFPQSSPVFVTTSALYHGAISWISSTLGGENSTGALSPSAASSTSAALLIRNSSLTATPAPVVFLSGGDYSMSTTSLCAFIRRSFEYSVDDSRLLQSMQFWAKSLLQVPFWYENAAFRHVLDVMLQCSMEKSFESSLLKNRSVHDSDKSDLLSELVALIQAAFDAFCQRIARREEARDPELQFLENESVVVMSFLPAATTSATFASIFRDTDDVAQYIGGCPYLSFWNLLVETQKEIPLFLAMGQLMIKYEPKTMKKIEKMKRVKGKLAAALGQYNAVENEEKEQRDEALDGTSRLSDAFQFSHTSMDSLSQYKIYRWCNYCLDLPESEPLQIIYWQVFFALYFATAGSSRVYGHHFLDHIGVRSPKHVHLRTCIQMKLRKLVSYCSNQAQVALTVTGTSSHSQTDRHFGSSADLKEPKYAHYVALSQLYTAMDAWMEERDPNMWLKEDNLTSLPRLYEVERLKEVLLLSDALLCNSSHAITWSQLRLWTDLCGFEFTRRRINPTIIGGKSSSADTMAQSLTVPLAPVGEEDDFSFVEEATEYSKQRHGFGGVYGLTSLTIRPLPLLSDWCSSLCLTKLPTVSVAVTKDQCRLTPSIALDHVGLNAVAMKFSENLSTILALDSEMMESVSQLYVSKARTVMQNVPCHEGTQCRSPAAFKFEYLEWMMDPRMNDMILSIRAQGERCDLPSMVRPSEISSRSHHGDELHENRDLALPASVTATEFLQLDGKYDVVLMQILLIDQVVRALGMELQRLKKMLEKEALVKTVAIEAHVDVSEQTRGAAVEELTPLQKTEQELKCLHSKGLEWFHLLTNLDTKLLRSVPSVREALWRSIKQLGRSFVCIDERETCTLLQLMLQDPSRIHLLSDCFCPSAAPSRFVEMFAMLMKTSNSSKLSSEQKLTLLYRFDFQTWLQSKTSQTQFKFDRDTILCIILKDVRVQFPADRNLVETAQKAKDTIVLDHLNQVLRVYAKILLVICSAHLADHVETMIRAVVGVQDDYQFQSSSVSSGGLLPCSDSRDEITESALTALPRPVDAVVWEALGGIPISTWKELAFVQIEACVTFLSQHMLTIRWQGGIWSSRRQSTSGEFSRNTKDASSASTGALTTYPLVYWQRLGVLKSLLDLFALFCRVAPEHHQWSIISLCFEPLLSTLYQPATSAEGSASSAPWSEHDSVSTGTSICSSFVAICSEYLKPSIYRSIGSSPSQHNELTPTTKLSQIWSFYLTALVPHAPMHICKHIYQYLTRLAWEHWCLTLEVVQQMCALVQTEKQQLSRVAIESTDEIVPPLASRLSPYPFVSWLVRDILCRTTWKATNTWLDAQSESICSSFLLAFAKLCIELVLDMPHFQLQSGPAVSANALPPYFMNFMIQQAVFWRKWKMTMEDLKDLQQFTLEALKEPIYSRKQSRMGIVSTELFPMAPSAATMQDAFTRLQLVLRLFGQITTMHHEKLLYRESLSRVNLFVNLLFGVYDGGTVRLRDNRDSTDHDAWLLVLYGATCTALYEKLDEIAQLDKVENVEKCDKISNARDVSIQGILTEEDLTLTIASVLRFCNLSIVEPFFQQMQRFAGNGQSRGAVSGTTCLNWSKCGTVVFVEIDVLLRDYASCPKAFAKPKETALCGDHVAIGGKDVAKTGDARTPSADAIGIYLGKILWSFLAFRGGELACLAACGRALASVHVMSHVAEKCIEKWIIEERRDTWEALTRRLQVPELSSDEFEASCLEHGNLLTLLVLFLQQLRRAPVLTESLSLALLTKVMNWMARARIDSSPVAQMKFLFLTAKVTSFVCKPLATILPSTLKKQMLRQLSDLLLESGHARRHNGLMKAIGLGGALQYGIEFHVSCLAAGIFLRLQTRSSAPLRVTNRIPLNMTRTTAKHVHALETMLQSKDAFQLGRRVDGVVLFAGDAQRSLADHDEFFVTLFSSTYPSQGWLLAKCWS